MYVPPQRVEALRCFGLKTGRDFAHLGLESDSFRGNVLRECINVFIVSILIMWQQDIISLWAPGARYGKKKIKKFVIFLDFYSTQTKGWC